MRLPWSKKKDNCCDELEERLWKVENPPKMKAGRVYNFRTLIFFSNGGSNHSGIYILNVRFVNKYHLYWEYDCLSKNGNVYSVYHPLEIEEVDAKEFKIKLK